MGYIFFLCDSVEAAILFESDNYVFGVEQGYEEGVGQMIDLGHHLIAFLVLAGGWRVARLVCVGICNKSESL